MKRLACISILIFTACVFLAAGKAVGEVRTSGDLSMWWIIYEDVENGFRQAFTDDESAQEASGFGINRARINFYYLQPEHHILGRINLRMEQKIMLYDVYVSYQPIDLFHIYLGQMKVPSTYEALTEEYNLDFASRTTLSSNISDYSLSRAPYISSLQGVRSYYRDIGVGVKGSWDAGTDHDVFKYFVMVSNGLGANYDIGAKENDGFMMSNEFGEYFYGVRADVSPWKWMTIGGHHSRNVHNNMLYRDKSQVFDFNRSSWSADMRLDLPWNFKAVGMYGEGYVDDDWFRDGKKNYEYSGWEAKVLKGFLDGKLELGVRYDTYEYELYESDDPVTEDHWTYGINFKPHPVTRIQLNYITKDTDSEYEEDLDDNIVLMNVEMFLEAAIK